MNDQTTQCTRLERNAQARLYRRCCEYTTTQKAELKEVFWYMKAESGGITPGLRKFARECNVSKCYATKIMAEIKDVGMD